MQSWQPEARNLPGGGPQGTILAMFLFLILINMAGFDDLEKNLGEKITKPKGKRKVMKTTHQKFVDDMTLAEAIDLKKALKPIPLEEIVRPVPYHSRTGHFLSPKESIIVLKT